MAPPKPWHIYIHAHIQYSLILGMWMYLRQSYILLKKSSVVRYECIMHNGSGFVFCVYFWFVFVSLHTCIIFMHQASESISLSGIACLFWGRRGCLFEACVRCWLEWKLLSVWLPCKQRNLWFMRISIIRVPEDINTKKKITDQATYLPSLSHTHRTWCLQIGRLITKTSIK